MLRRGWNISCFKSEYRYCGLDYPSDQGSSTYVALSLSSPRSKVNVRRRHRGRASANREVATALGVGAIEATRELNACVFELLAQELDGRTPKLVLEFGNSRQGDLGQVLNG